MRLLQHPSIFLARGLARSSRSGESGFTRTLSLTTLSITLSLAVMLLAVSIILGFRGQVRSFAFSQTGHISLSGYGASWRDSNSPLYISDPFLQYLRHSPGVRSVMPLIQEAGLIKTEESFDGISLYGVDSSFHSSYFDEQLRQGRLPKLQGSEQPEIALPSHLASSLGYKLGDKVRIYFMGDKMRVRAFQLVGIYESAGLELSPALCPLVTLQRLRKWDEHSYSRLLIMLERPDEAPEVLDRLVRELEQRPELIGGERYGLNLGQELQPELFSWLAVLDTNVYALLALMLLVGGFSMITGLVILVLDKSRQIGILKALGSKDSTLRLSLLLLSGRIIVKGLFWGNLLALSLCLLQQHYRIIRLNPANYFTDAVPIQLDLLLWLGINLGTLVLILAMILIPTRLVGRIRPAESMRID